MSDHTHEFETDADPRPTRPGQLSSNGHWVFGSIYAAFILIAFSFGVWAGVSKPKPTETADAKQKDNTDKAGDKQTPKGPVVTPPAPPVEPKPKDPDTTPKPPDTTPKPPDTTPKPPDPVPNPPTPAAMAETALATIGAKVAVKGPAPVTPPVKEVSFKQVAPVLGKYCNICHGLSAGKPKAGIDLRTIAAIKKGGDPGEILKVGDPMKSKLYTSMLADASEPMPPAGKPAPSPEEIKLIHDWIASGAKPRRTIRRRGVAATRARLQLTAGGDAG